MLPPKTHVTSQRGQSLVLIALMASGLLAFVGLALDGGQVFLIRRQMQNSADAAAFAGVQELAYGQSSLIYYRINQYATSNSTVGNGADDFQGVYMPSGIPIAPGVPPPANTNCISVTSHKNFKTLVISLLGFNTLDAKGTAAACTGPLVAPAGIALRPFGVYSQTFQFNVDYCLFSNGGTDPRCPNTTPGSFGWIDYDGGNNNSSDTASWLYNGSNGPFNLIDGNTCNGTSHMESQVVAPTCLPRDTGVSGTSDIRGAMDYLKTSGLEIIIPVYDATYGTGANATMHVISFAKFVVTDYSFGNPKFVKGQFRQYVDLGRICLSNCPPNPLSTKGVQLTQ